MLITELRADARYLVSPSLTSTGYPDAALDRNLNNWYETVCGWLIAADGEWEFNGTIMYRDFLTGVTTYQMPSALIRLYKAEVMYQTGGSFVPVNPINIQALQDSAEGNATRTGDDVTRPTIEVYGDFVEIRPAPEEDVVNGIKLWIQKELLALDGSVNKLPDLPKPVHRALSVGAAFDYAIAKEMYEKAAELKRLIYGDPRVKDDEDSIKKMVENLQAIKAGNRRHQAVARRRSYR